MLKVLVCVMAIISFDPYWLRTSLTVLSDCNQHLIWSSKNSCHRTGPFAAFCFYSIPFPFHFTQFKLIAPNSGKTLSWELMRSLAASSPNLFQGPHHLTQKANNINSQRLQTHHKHINYYKPTGTPETPPKESGKWHIRYSSWIQHSYPPGPST